jgi:uncharacterized protein (TIGR02145 family)
VSDNIEASAGWYWQFNRKQGYKPDGLTLTPSWIKTTISENSNWQTEWYNVDSVGGWTNWKGQWGSGLKLHATGYLNFPDGALYERGSYGYYWCSTQHDSSSGWRLYFHSGDSGMYDHGKAYGFSVRCLRDNCFI